MMARNRLLTESEEKIIREQIVKNSFIIQRLVFKIDLLMNREGHKKDSRVVANLRNRLEVLMAENDTFRRVFWEHVQLVEDAAPGPEFEAVRYMILKIKERNRNGGADSFFCEYEVGSAKK